MGTSADITGILAAIGEGDRDRFDELFEVVYDHLRLLARQRRLAWHGDNTMNTTALVHEAYLKLAGRDDPAWENRRHFFNAASRAMRQILIDHAVKRRAAKRGGGQENLELDQVAIADDQTADELIALDQALKRLEKLHERQCRVVEHRFFGGLTIAETAEVLEVSRQTVTRDWTMASAWLKREMGSQLTVD